MKQRAFLLPLLLALHGAWAGDFAVYPTPLQVHNKTEITVRQEVCHLYRELQFNPDKQLKDALSGLELRPILTFSEFFHYNDTHGIDEDNPGLAADILDNLAERAGFTWRNSFAVTPGPENGTTWTEALELYTEVFDISIDYWDKNTDRLNRGIAFLEQWFDGNMILIEKVLPLEEDTSVNYWNFMKPFDRSVWIVTLFTVIFSALVYQWLEWLNNERDERTLWQWFEDNLYLSSMNFTQQYMHEPTSGAGRIFGFSMAVWAMVMGATYTANLASLFVEELGQPTKVADIDEAITKGYKLCTWKGTNADNYIATRYPQATRVRMPTELETYQGLHTGKCQVNVGAQATWLGYVKDKDHNPCCDAEWVGKTVEEVSSSFAVKADTAVKCTNLIRDVLNYHLSDMAIDGTMAKLWSEHYDTNDRGIDCDLDGPGKECAMLTEMGEIIDTETALTRRLLSWDYPTNNPQTAARQLKGGGGGGANSAAAANGGGDDEDSNSLTLDAMAGTFVLHASLCGLAMVVGLFSWYNKKSKREKSESEQEDTFPIGEDLAVTKERVAAWSMANGTCAKNNRVNSFLKQNGTVDEKLHALFEAQKDLQQNQEQLAQQMELVVSMLTKMQEKDQLSQTEGTTATETSHTSNGGIGKMLFG